MPYVFALANVGHAGNQVFCGTIYGNADQAPLRYLVVVRSQVVLPCSGHANGYLGPYLARFRDSDEFMVCLERRSHMVSDGLRFSSVAAKGRGRRPLAAAEILPADTRRC